MAHPHRIHAPVITHPFPVLESDHPPWPQVPNHAQDNDSLLSTEKAQRLPGYRPRPGGRYFRAEVI